jgi:hypothetical protein
MKRRQEKKKTVFVIDEKQRYVPLPSHSGGSPTRTVHTNCSRVGSIMKRDRAGMEDGDEFNALATRYEQEKEWKEIRTPRRTWGSPCS